VPGWVSRGKWRDPPGFELSVVDVAFVAEEDAAAAAVLAGFVGVVGVPAVACEFLVGAVEEVVALGFCLADEQHERGLLVPAKRRTPFLD
jgi:hypothetical protein